MSEGETKKEAALEETGSFQRRSPLKAAVAAFNYLREAIKADKVQIRTSDRVTIIVLLVCCILEVLSLVWSPMASFRFAFVLLLDLGLGISILMFLLYRFGILSTLNHRQVIITWQLMMGCLFAGVFICINAALALAFLVTALGPNEAGL